MLRYVAHCLPLDTPTTAQTEPQLFWLAHQGRPFTPRKLNIWRILFGKSGSSLKTMNLLFEGKLMCISNIQCRFNDLNCIKASSSMISREFILLALNCRYCSIPYTNLSTFQLFVSIVLIFLAVLQGIWISFIPSLAIFGFLCHFTSASFSSSVSWEEAETINSRGRWHKDRPEDPWNEGFSTVSLL